MFAKYLVVVVALFGSQLGGVVDAADSTQCAYLKKTALTIIRQSTPYTSACKVRRLDYNVYFGGVRYGNGNCKFI